MFLLLGLLGTALLAPVVYDLFDDDDCDQNKTPPEETGQVLTYDGSELLEGTEGDDTVPAGQDDGLAPLTINLLGGDDVANVDSIPNILGGDGNDEITATGVQSTLEGGAGNDTLTADDSNHLLGGVGDDVLNFTHGSYDQGEWGSVDGGEGDDTINVRADAFVPAGLEGDVGGVEVTGGDGADNINITYEFNENFLFEPTDNIEGRFIEISDFNPSEDNLVIEVDRNDDTTDRDITVELDQTEDNGTYTSLITLTFAETDEMQEATNILTISSSSPFTLADIQLIGV